MATRVGPFGRPLCPLGRPKHLRCICHTSRLTGDFMLILGVRRPKSKIEEQRFVHRVSKKLCKLIFCHNFAKFRRIVKIFGTKIAERTGFCEVYSFSTSPNLCTNLSIFILARMLTNFNNYFVVVFADEMSAHYRVKCRCSKLLHNAVIISLQ